MAKKVIDVPRLIAWLEARRGELQEEFGIDDEVFETLEVDLLTLIRTAKAHQPGNIHARGGKNVWLWYYHSRQHMLTLVAEVK